MHVRFYVGLCCAAFESQAGVVLRRALLEISDLQSIVCAAEILLNLPVLVPVKARQSWIV